VEPRPRLVPLTGAFNFRDLGGYPALQGRATRWGRLFRSDTLHELTGPDVDRIESMGIMSIIDLRTDGELEHTGRGPLADRAIGFHHFSVIGDGGGEVVAAPAPVGENLSERYLWYLEGGSQALVDALVVLSEPRHLPAVFHCAAGKDRTGVLAALVLDILGVDPEVIVADYLITRERMPLILGRYRADPAFAQRMATVPASRFGVEASTMEGFLTGLQTRFGGARRWAVDAGVPPAALHQMADQLLEPVE
jgi:protein-tyrosine phosphatase